MSSPELTVVCKSCGSEVSPYVTECPYCGTRLRKRAPKLELRGDELAPRGRRRGRRLRDRLPSRLLAADRPYATVAMVVAPAAFIVVQRAAGLSLFDVGAIIGPVGGEWWRYLVSPFVYDDLGYLFVCALAIVLFALPVERRLGSVATVVLLVASGALGMLAADAAESARDAGLIAIGGNGIALGALAAWIVIRGFEVRGRVGEQIDAVAVLVAAAVLVALPLIDDGANVFAGLAGAVVGAACGLAAALARRGEPIP